MGLLEFIGDSIDESVFKVITRAVEMAGHIRQSAQDGKERDTSAQFRYLLSRVLLCFE
jgi:hypothetical protein